MNQKGFTAVYLLVGVLILAVLGGGYYFSKAQIINIPPLKNSPTACTQEAKQCPDGSYVGRGGPNCEFSPCPITFFSTKDETANWKTYSNQSLRISFKYPTDKNFKEYSVVNGKSILIGVPSSDYALNIAVFDNSRKLGVKDWIKANFDLLYSRLEINGKKLSFQDLILTDRWLVGQQAIEVNFGGQGPDIFFPHPSNLKMFKLTTNFNKDLFDQILSTFRFD